MHVGPLEFSPSSCKYPSTTLPQLSHMTTFLHLPLPFLHLPPSRAPCVWATNSLVASTSSNTSALLLLTLSPHPRRRGHSRRSSPVMSSSITQPSVRELRDESDFYKLPPPPASSPSAASALYSPAKRSARSTFPDLVNFRVARLNGFRPAFAHVAPIFFERGIAKPETKEISSLSVEPCEGETLIVTVFEIKKLEIPAFIEREHEFRFLAVTPETLDGDAFDAPAVLCGRYSDEEFFQVRCKGSKEIYFQAYGRYDIYKIWRDDIFPCRIYLRHCVLAAKNLSNVAYDNFLDHTFLGNRKTTIREYLATTGAGIMEEEPPESKCRYGG